MILLLALGACSANKPHKWSLLPDLKKRKSLVERNSVWRRSRSRFYVVLYFSNDLEADLNLLLQELNSRINGVMNNGEGGALIRMVGTSSPLKLHFFNPANYKVASSEPTVEAVTGE